ncbi:hypothetical protein HDV03_004109 [Kappamyces sp. JEL0829]|nr:hypothetical protein HDV03_004109 [Kappamyces sp. JEL0829]
MTVVVPTQAAKSETKPASELTLDTTSGAVQFHERFNSSPRLDSPWKKVKTHFKFLGPALAKTSMRASPKAAEFPPEWDLSYRIAVKGAFNIMESISEPEEPNAFYLEEINAIQNPLPRKATLSKQSYLPDPAVIEFMKAHTNHEWPAVASNTKLSVYGEWVDARNIDTTKVVYQLHGGAYVLGSSQLYRRMSYFISKAANARCYTPNYRLAPLNPYPCAVIDAVSGYIELLKVYKPQDIVLMGDSAGGGLALATLMVIRDMGLPSPAGGYLESPWVDLKITFDSFSTQHGIDLLPAIPKDVRLGTRLHYYASNEDLEVPYVSPLYGSFDNLPPLFIQCGTVEKLYGEVVALAQKVQGPMVFETYKSHVHVFQQLRPVSKGAKIATDRAGEWIQSLLAGTSQTGRQKIELDFYGQVLNTTTL